MLIFYGPCNRWCLVAGWSNKRRRRRSLKIHWFGSGSSIFGWIPVRIRGFDDQKLKKITGEKTVIFCWSKFAIYLSLSLYKGHPGYRRSSPDPDSESGSVSTDLIESRSNPDLDPETNTACRQGLGWTSNRQSTWSPILQCFFPGRILPVKRNCVYL